MFRRLLSLFTADRANKSSSRTLTASKRKPASRPGLNELEARLFLSSVPLHVVGNQVEDPQGHVIVLHGVNVNSLEFRPDGDNVLQAESIAINDWHCNLIRVPVNQDYWFGYNQWWSGSSSGDGGAAYRALVAQIITTAQAANVYVVLDLHWSDMGAFGAGNDGQHFLPDQNSTLFWQSAATTYASNPAVLFDPYNEPTLGVWNAAGGWWDFTPTNADFQLWRDGGTVVQGDVAGNTGATIGTYTSPGMQGLINTIRGTGATNIIVPEGLNWGSDISGVMNGYALTDPLGNLMYQVHLYPGEDSSSALAAATQYPIYVGEWGDGGVVGSPDPAAVTWNTNMIAFLHTNNFSWTAWDLSPEAGTGFNLLTSWNATATTSDFGALVKADLTVQYSGAVVDIYGDNQVDDQFTLGIGASSLAVGINGADQTIPSTYNTLRFHGLNGADSITITGGSAAETVNFTGTGGTVSSSSYTIDLDTIENKRFIGQANDIGTLTAASTTDIFIGRPTYSTMTGGTYSNRIDGSGNVTANAVTGTNTNVAYLYDSAGNDTFYSNPTYAYLKGTGFYNTAKGFSSVYACATAGGTDTAKLYGSTGSNTFLAKPTYAYMQGTGFYDRVNGFKSVCTFAVTGGTDKAYLYDLAGNDTFCSTSTYSYLKGTGFYNYANAFSSVYGYASSGTDTADLYDTAGNDTFVGNTLLKSVTSSYMSGSGLMRRATGFDKVYAYATAGGADTAYVYGTSGADQFHARSNWGQLTQWPTSPTSYFVYFSGFDSATINSSSGSDGYDVSGLLYPVTYVSTGHWKARAG